MVSQTNRSAFRGQLMTKWVQNLCAKITVLLSLSGWALPAFAGDYATIIMYHRFGESKFPSTNIALDQFDAHLAYLAEGGFTVLPVPDIIETLEAGGELPDRTVGITIDDAYLSVYTEAWPRLKSYEFPFTLFIATDPIDRGYGNYMSWDQLRELQQNGVSMGSQTKSHPHMHRISAEQVVDELRLSNERFIEELGLRPDLFAYPYGEYSLSVIEAVKQAGFSAAFGQNSGVMHSDDLWFELPRFAFNETYGTLDRLKLAVNGKPLRVVDITPADMVLSENPPLYGFTLAESLMPARQLRCFASGYGQVEVTQLGRRAEVRLPGALNGPRARINCTMPAGEGRWRWFGRQFLTE